MERGGAKWGRVPPHEDVRAALCPTAESHRSRWRLPAPNHGCGRAASASRTYCGVLNKSTSALVFSPCHSSASRAVAFSQSMLAAALASMRLGASSATD